MTMQTTASQNTAANLNKPKFPEQPQEKAHTQAKNDRCLLHACECMKNYRKSHKEN